MDALLLLQCNSTRDNLNELCGDHGLARTIELERELRDHVTSVGRSVLHRLHSRRLCVGRRMNVLAVVIVVWARKRTTNRTKSHVETIKEGDIPPDQ